MDKAERERWEREAASKFKPAALGRLYRPGAPQRDKFGRFTATTNQILSAIRRAHQPPEYRRR